MTCVHSSAESLKDLVGKYRSEKVVQDFSTRLTEWSRKMEKWFTSQEKKIKEWNEQVTVLMGDDAKYLKIAPLSRHQIMIRERLYEFSQAPIPADMRTKIFDTIITLLDEVNTGFVEKFENLFAICTHLLHLNIKLSNSVSSSANELKDLQTAFTELSSVTALQNEVAGFDFQVALAILEHDKTCEKYSANVINEVIRFIFASDSDSDSDSD
uniref:Uncharacterized protein n=1 Tax=Vannella robusta TaxID=1487602 RepID=A0A7S4IQB1_9EUKA|mmetsp:Transcript_6558/g.8102  ORF Transcript_6558/g.8102 Transcript_6558/m.8102 type:complete len:212 (+) Transcript_6558:189-824(+)